MLSFVLLIILFQLGRWPLFWVNYHVFLTCLIYLSIHPSILLSILPSIHQSIHLSVCTSLLSGTMLPSSLILYFPCFSLRIRPHPPQPLYVLSCLVMSNSVTPRTAACQALLSMGFSRQEWWSGLPCPPPGDLPDPGIEPTSHDSRTGRQVLCHLGGPRKQTCDTRSDCYHSERPHMRSGHHRWKSSHTLHQHHTKFNIKPEISYYISYNRHTLDIMTITEQRKERLCQKKYYYSPWCRFRYTIRRRALLNNLKTCS